ncbi:hypothetical protein COTS27_01453 [Spirochaetota bacterium]|nr:hypothetical protein COTS27_01453 [Spirochaetota bacterium]
MESSSHHSEEDLKQSADRALKERLHKAFSPAMPINDVDAFYGRYEELERLSEAIDEPGMHIMLYGERGIGKTSLANVIFARDPSLHFIKITCTEREGFTNLWRHILTQLKSNIGKSFFSQSGHTKKTNLPAAAFENFKAHIDTALTDSERKSLSTETIIKILHPLPKKLVIVLDEFDVAAKQETVSQLFAGLIKTFSDRLPQITLLFVGIANNSTELIAEHPSLERCFSQIMLKRMNMEEMSDLLTGCLLKVKLTTDGEVKTLLLTLAAGFPYYVHMLGKYAAESALTHRYTVITKANLKASVEKAIRNTFASIVTAYKKATQPNINFPPRAKWFYSEVLEAAAQFKPQNDFIHTPEHLTEPSNEEICFSAKELLPFISIKAAAFDDQAGQYPKKVSLALSQLTRSSRGTVLRKIPRLTSHTPVQYQFENPLLRAFILLKLYLK